jgi:hypothetical protein
MADAEHIAGERTARCTNLDLIQLTMSDYVIHSTAGRIGEVDSMLSRTRASLAPAQPVLYILDNIDPLAKLAAKR